MAEKFSRYDSADYLRTEAEVAAYLDACVEEGEHDPAFITHALGVVARARGMMQLSEQTGISRAGLYKALSGEGNPTFDTVARVAKALGLRISFQPASSTHTSAEAH